MSRCFHTIVGELCPAVAAWIPTFVSGNSSADAAVGRLLKVNKKLHHQLGGNHISRQASIALGGAFLRASIAAFGDDSPEALAILEGLRKSSRIPLDKEGTPAHQGVVFGAVAGLLQCEAGEARRMYLYLHLRDTLSAATRLNLVGPMEAAKLQRKLGLVAEAVCEDRESQLREGALTVEESEQIHHQYAHISSEAVAQAATAAPILELLQASHACMYSRLFSS